MTNRYSVWLDIDVSSGDGYDSPLGLAEWLSLAHSAEPRHGVVVRRVAVEFEGEVT